MGTRYAGIWTLEIYCRALTPLVYTTQWRDWQLCLIPGFWCLGLDSETTSRLDYVAGTHYET